MAGRLVPGGPFRVGILAFDGCFAAEIFGLSDLLLMANRVALASTAAVGDHFEVSVLSAGGGLVSAARKPVHGRQRVAQLILGVLEKFGQGIETVAVVANGAGAMLGVREGHPVALWTLDIAPDGVRRLMIVMNPHKLERFAASALSHS